MCASDLTRKSRTDTSLRKNCGAFERAASKADQRIEHRILSPSAVGSLIIPDLVVSHRRYTMAHVVRSLCSRPTLSLLRSHVPRLAVARSLSLQTCGREERAACVKRPEGVLSVTLSRCFGAYGPDRTPVDVKMVEERVMKVVRAYDKIDAASVSHMVQSKGERRG